jgi:Zn-dependent peptidase ImmA (M78 family)
MTNLAELLISRTLRQLQRVATKAEVPIERLRELALGQEPSMAELRPLADALRVPLQELVATPSKPQEHVEFLFRNTASLADSAIVGRLARTVGSTIELIKDRRAMRPDWRHAFAPAESSLANAEANAAVFRTVFCDNDQLSPLINLPERAADRMGAFIFVIRNSHIDGASAYLDGIPYAFVSARFKARMLFTLAHELGHLVAHHGDEEFATVDASIEKPVPFGGPDDEAYANSFASALLMPRMAVGIALRSIRKIGRITSDQIGDIEIGYLARIFGLSFWAAARRCEGLDLLPRGGAYALNQELIKHYGSAEKRGDELGLPSRANIVFPPIPKVLLDAAVSSVKSGELSVGKAANMLGLSVSDLFSANRPTAH